MEDDKQRRVRRLRNKKRDRPHQIDEPRFKTQRRTPQRTRFSNVTLDPDELEELEDYFFDEE